MGLFDAPWLGMPDSGVFTEMQVVDVLGWTEDVFQPDYIKR